MSAIKFTARVMAQQVLRLTAFAENESVRNILTLAAEEILDTPKLVLGDRVQYDIDGVTELSYGCGTVEALPKQLAYLRMDFQVSWDNGWKSFINADGYPYANTRCIRIRRIEG